MEFIWMIDRSVIYVEDKCHALQHPVRRVFGRAQIGHEDLAHSHRVLAVLGDVNRRLQVVLDLELAGLSRDDLDDRHLADELLRSE